MGYSLATGTSHVAKKEGTELTRGSAFPGRPQTTPMYRMGSMPCKQQDKRKREQQIRMFGILQGPAGSWLPPDHPRAHAALWH